MTKIELEIHDDVITAINKVQNINDTGIELHIPIGSVLFENIINIKLLKQQIEKLGKSLVFLTEDSIGQNLLNMLEDIPQVIHEPTVRNKLALPKFGIPKIKLPAFKFGFKNKFWYVFGVLLVGGYIYLGLTLPIATAKIVVNSQPLTRSLTMLVDSNKDTDFASKTLRGITLTSRIERSAETETTGEKIIGEKAKGDIKILNKTLAEKTFDKGQKVIYDDDDLTYELKNDVTIPAATDDGLSLTYGTAVIEVEAIDIGSDYNISKDKLLLIDKENETDFSALALDKFGGGSSKTIKVVAQEDLDLLENLISENLGDEINKTLKNKVASSQNLINGSETSAVVMSNNNYALDEETDLVSLTQTLDVYGLVYMDQELNILIDDLVKEFIPEGFELSPKDRETNVEVLGNTSESVLNSTTADIQVTLKAFVIPEINEDVIKQDLAGANSKEAARILSGIRNVQNYEYKVNPAIPFFRRAPRNLANINIEIERQ